MNWSAHLSTLLTAGGALLGVVITMTFTVLRERRQLQQERLLVGMQARRDAFVELARTARLLVRHLRQVAWRYEIAERFPGTEPPASGSIAPADELFADFAAAHAAARLQASPQARPALDRLYSAVNKFEDLIEMTQFNQAYDIERGDALFAEIEETEREYLDACQADIDFHRLGAPDRRRLGRS